MDQILYQSLTHFITSQFLKTATQLLLSVSVFSIFFHSFKLHFTTFSLQFLTQIMGKNFIFLICNGILMFLVKTSGFISSSPPVSSDHTPQLYMKIGDIANGLIEKEVDYTMEGQTENSNGVSEYQEEEEEEEAPTGLLNTSGEIPITKDEVGVKDLDSIGFSIKEDEDDDDDEDDDEEEDGLPSRDELNKKFDEFIRRTKEGIRIEAQQQLIMAQ